MGVELEPVKDIRGCALRHAEHVEVGQAAPLAFGRAPAGIAVAGVEA
jgi:hypothetical protein